MKIISRLFIILIAFLLLTFYFLKQPQDITGLSKQIDMKVNSVLVHFGISDENIIKSFSVEKKTKSARWLEFTKEIKTDRSREEILRNIKYGLEEYPVNVRFSADKNSVLVFKDDALVNRILFFVPRRTMKAAIIIDDIGRDAEALDKFLKLGISLTYSVMPGEKYSAEIAEKLSAEKQVVFLHQPMQPEGFPKVDPGTRALLLKMSEKNIRDMFEKNISGVPGAAGVNNHMGSAFTRDRDKMEQFMKCVKKKNIIFLDSHTSPGSVAYKVAMSNGVPCLRNDFFLDNKDDLKYILGQLEIFKKHVLRNGEGVAIGHVHKKNLPLALEKIIPEFKRAGIEFLTVPEYVKTENR